MERRRGNRALVEVTTGKVTEHEGRDFSFLGFPRMTQEAMTRCRTWIRAARLDGQTNREAHES